MRSQDWFYDHLRHLDDYNLFRQKAKLADWCLSHGNNRADMDATLVVRHALGK